MPNAKSYCNIATGDDFIILMGDKTGTPNLTWSTAYNGHIKSLNPDMIIGIGDYETSQLTGTKISVLMKNIGGIRRYSAPGNHDLDINLTNRNGFNTVFGCTYKKIRAKNVDFFIYDLYLSDDETSFYSYEDASARNEASFKGTTQGLWLQAELLASTAPWKIVMFHQDCTDWTSGTVLFNLRLDGMKWDWKAYGVDVLINGHEHIFERLLINTGSGNLPIIDLGVAGAAQNPVPGSPVAGSQYLSGSSEDADLTAGMIYKLEASRTALTIKAYGIKADLTISTLKDTLSLSK